MEGVVLVIFLVILGITIIFFIVLFKGLDFILSATDLYKKMIQKEDEIIKLLIEIRDNTIKEAAVTPKEEQVVESHKIIDIVKTETESLATASVDIKEENNKKETVESKKKFCYHCGKEIAEGTITCPKCGAPI
jgi:hypothetical protein